MIRDKCSWRWIYCRLCCYLLWVLTHLFLCVQIQNPASIAFCSFSRHRSNQNHQSSDILIDINRCSACCLSIAGGQDFRILLSSGLTLRDMSTRTVIVVDVLTALVREFLDCEQNTFGKIKHAVHRSVTISSIVNIGTAVDQTLSYETISKKHSEDSRSLIRGSSPYTPSRTLHS